MHIKLFLFFILIVAGIAACAETSHYAINVNYIPKKVSPGEQCSEEIAITIAAFNDARTVDDKTIIGKKVKSKNDKILALATAENPAREVSSAFRYFF